MRLAAAVGWCSTFFVAALPAQTVLRGNVVDTTGAGIEAEILLDDGRRGRTTAGATGEFSFDLPGPGVYEVLARRIGFAPATRRVLVADGDTVSVRFQLRPTAQQLDPIVVEGTGAGAVSAKMRGFAERRRLGFGKFLTRSMLAEREHSALSDVLRMVSGLHFVRRPADCGGGFALASGRGGFVNHQPWMRCVNPPFPFPAACYLAIFIDGTRVWFPGDLEPPAIDNVASVVGLEGIEVYRGPSETPIQYQGTGAACGVVLLWTRTDEGER